MEGWKRADNRAVGRGRTGRHSLLKMALEMATTGAKPTNANKNINVWTKN